MKICKNENCLEHKQKTPQEGSNCSRCSFELIEVSGGFNLVRFFQNYNWQWLNSNVIKVLGVVASLSILGFIVYHFMDIPPNTEGGYKATTSLTLDVVKNLKDYIQAERYDSVWAIVNSLNVEASNIDKSTTVQLSKIDAEQAHSWDMTYMNDKLNIKIMPYEKDFEEWIRNGNYEKIQQYISDDGFTYNDKTLLVKDWIQNLKNEKTKGEKLFILKNPKNNQYRNVGVYNIRKPLPNTDLVALFKSGWSLDKVEVNAVLKPEIKNRVESKIKSLNELVRFAQEGILTDEAIQEIVGGVDLSSTNVIIHEIKGGSHNENIKSFLYSITTNCKKCKIVPISCTPTESAYDDGKSQNIFLRDIQFLRY
jgi:hypothetical protein